MQRGINNNNNSNIPWAESAQSNNSGAQSNNLWVPSFPGQAYPGQAPPRQPTARVALVSETSERPTGTCRTESPISDPHRGRMSEVGEGALIDKPAVVFTSSDSLHGGQETTLFTMSLPLLHHGMMVLGVPYSQQQLSQTTTGGTPYGPTHVNRSDQGYGSQNKLSDDEAKIAFAAGKRLAKIAQQLQTMH